MKHNWKNSGWKWLVVVLFLCSGYRNYATVFTVTSLADAGTGTLRQAMLNANADGGFPHFIQFSVTGTILLQTSSGTLPQLSHPTTIDGGTLGQVVLNCNGVDFGFYFAQAGSNGSLITNLVIQNYNIHGIVLAGNGLNQITIHRCRIGTDASGNTAAVVNTSAHGIVIDNTQNHTISNCQISGVKASGIEITFSKNITIRGNYIGVNAAGTTAIGNGTGIALVNTTNAVTIGGLAIGDRNLISGNGTGIRMDNAKNNKVAGNFIGIAANGTSALGNGASGIELLNSCTGNIIGGTSILERNIISGNTLNGISMNNAKDNKVAGNFIGIAANGTSALGNGASGIELVNSCTGNIFGGTSILERNIISGNTRNGIFLNHAKNNIVSGNYIGLSMNGLTAVGNGSSGIKIENNSNGNIFGGTLINERNVISGNTQYGIYMDNAKNNKVSGNFIGIAANGTTALGNRASGIRTDNSCTGNIFGGNLPAERNVISGNSEHGIQLTSYSSFNEIYGNYIGTDSSGMLDLGNNLHGIDIVTNSNYITIGSTSSTSGNLISGNNLSGIQINSGCNYNLIQGNIIGLNATQTSVIGNIQNGVSMSSSSFNTVGGWNGVGGNIISGNGSGTANYGPFQFSGVSASTYDNNPINDIYIIGNKIGLNQNGQRFENGNHGIWIWKDNSSSSFGSFTIAQNEIGINPGNTYATPEQQNRSTIYVFQINRSSVMYGNKISYARRSGIMVVKSSLVTIGGINGNEITNCQQQGIEISGSSQISIWRNAIGTDLTGTLSGGNSLSGIFISSNSTNIEVGKTVAGWGNLIANNKQHGILVDGNGSNFNTLRGNSIYCNALKGIALTNAANQNIQPPTLDLSSSSGVLNGTAAAGSTVDLYQFATCNPCQGVELQGKTYLGTVLADANGRFSFTPIPNSLQLTATQTNAQGSTSEFSSRLALVTQGFTTCGLANMVPIQLSNATPGDVYTLANGGGVLQTLTAVTSLLPVTLSGATWSAGIQVITVTSQAGNCGATGTPRLISILVNPVVATVPSFTSSICSGQIANVTIGGITSGVGYYVLSTTGVVLASAQQGNTTLQFTLPSSGWFAGNYGFQVLGSVPGCTPTVVSTGSQTIQSFDIQGLLANGSTICGSGDPLVVSLSQANPGDTYGLLYKNQLLAQTVAGSSNLSFSLSTASFVLGENIVQVYASRQGCGTTSSINVPVLLQYATNTGWLPVSAICKGISATVTLAGYSNRFVYHWGTASGFVSNPSFPNAETAVYNLNTSSWEKGIYTLGVTSSIAGCSYSNYSFSIQINDDAGVKATVSGGGKFCVGSTVTVSATGSSRYLWQFPNAVKVLSVTADSSQWVLAWGTTSGFVKAFPARSCGGQWGIADSIAVTVVSPPSVDAGGSLASPTDNIKRYPIQFADQFIPIRGKISPYDSTLKYQISWSAPESQDLINSSQLSASVLPKALETKVYLTVNNGYCTSKDSALVLVDMDKIPAAFSPSNGDEINNTWRIDNLYLYPKAKIQVFNKWGNEVYSSVGYPRSPDQMWDGKHNGVDLPVAVYYYIIDLGTETKREPKIGSVTIVR